jgi:hypothetical protein
MQKAYYTRKQSLPAHRDGENSLQPFLLICHIWPFGRVETRDFDLLYCTSSTDYFVYSFQLMNLASNQETWSSDSYYVSATAVYIFAWWWWPVLPVSSCSIGVFSSVQLGVMVLESALWNATWHIPIQASLYFWMEVWMLIWWEKKLLSFVSLAYAILVYKLYQGFKFRYRKNFGHHWNYRILWNSAEISPKLF